MNYQAIFRFSGAELTNFKTKINERGKRGKFERRNLIGRNQNNNNQNTQFFVFQRSVASHN